MTVGSDIAAFSPSATARGVFQSKGADLPTLLGALQQQALEMRRLLAQVLAYHPNGSVLSATIHTAGSGGTTGPVTISGTSGAGTRFTARGIIAAGALTGPLTIINAGSYTSDPTSLVSEPITGGGLTGATVALTISGDTANLTALSNILAELT